MFQKFVKLMFKNVTLCHILIINYKYNIIIVYTAFILILFFFFLSFWKFCNSLVNSELIFLRVLKFDVNTKLAYQYLLRFFQDYLISDFCDLKYEYNNNLFNLGNYFIKYYI